MKVLKKIESVKNMPSNFYYFFLNANKNKNDNILSLCIDTPNKYVPRFKLYKYYYRGNALNNCTIKK